MTPNDGSSDKEYQEYLNQQEYAKYQQASAQAANPQTLPDQADKAASPNKPVVNRQEPSALLKFLNRTGIVPAQKESDLDADAAGAPRDPRAQPALDHPENHYTAENLARISGGMAAGALSGGIAPALGLEGAGTLATGGRALLSGGLGAGAQAAIPPSQGESRGAEALKGFLGGALPELVPPAISAIKGAGGSMMKRATGLTGLLGKNAPADIGERMADEGIFGTRESMASQVADKYADVEDTVQNLAKFLKGTKGGDEMAAEVRSMGDRFIDPATKAPYSAGEEGSAAFNNVADSLETRAPGYSSGTPETKTPTEFMQDEGKAVPVEFKTTPATPPQQGAYGGQQLLALKRLGDEQAFNQSGAMGNTYKAEAYRSQADSARNALADMSNGAMPQALKQEQTLLYANKGLMKPQTTYRNPVGMTDIGSAMVGAASHGLPGATTAVLASKAATLPLIQSAAAQGLFKGAAPIMELLRNPQLARGLFEIMESKNGQ